MWNANTRISSLAVSHVNRLCHRISYVKRVTRTLIGVLNHVCSPYSAQLRCKLFAIIRNSSLVKVMILTIFYAVKLQKVAVKQISTLLARKVSKPFSAQNSFSFCKSCLSHLFVAACREHICLESFLNTIKLHVERQKVCLYSNSQSFNAKLDCCWNANTRICFVGAIHITRSIVVQIICTSNIKRYLLQDM